MMYAIQGNNVRWFFSPEEDEHLFSQFSHYDSHAEVIVKGNWNEGLVFTPIIYKGRRPNNGANGSFPIIAIPGEAGNIKTIATPIEYLRVSRILVTNLKPTATIFCKKIPDRREIIVYPQVMHAENYQEEPENETETTGMNAESEPKPAADPQHDPLQPEVWAGELVDEINSILKANPTVTVLIGQNGKEIKFVRKVVKRRQIV